ncbi:MAG: hypothetical protein MZV70_51010 [Desulfobacterales bacterium]|nr:hypothetical protein [Desulfobacterales bacterium]
MPLNATNLPDHHHGHEHAAILMKAGRKIRHFDDGAVLICQTGNQNSRIGQIGLL